MRRMTLLFAVLTAVSWSTLCSAQEKSKEAPKATPAETEAVAAVKKLGGAVLQVAQNDNRLDVAYHLADGKVGDDHLAPIKALGNVMPRHLLDRRLNPIGEITETIAAEPALIPVMLQRP